MDTARVGVFMGFAATTTKQMKVYCPELGYTIRSSRVEIDESVQGGTVDLRLRTLTYNTHKDRNPRGRPKKVIEAEPANSFAEPGSPNNSTATYQQSSPQVVIPPFTPPKDIPYYEDTDEMDDRGQTLAEDEPSEDF